MQIKNTDKTQRNKKSQQEIVGFVIIVVLVAIIAVVFLGIFLRQRPEVVTDDVEINNFLSAAIKYTSDCYRDEETKFKNLGELLGDCYALKSCSDGRTCCDVANSTFTALLDSLWKASDQGAVKYYKLSFYYTQNISDNDAKIPLSGLVSISKGDLTGCVNNRAGRKEISHGDGDIVIEMQICKNTA